MWAMDVITVLALSLGLHYYNGTSVEDKVYCEYLSVEQFRDIIGVTRTSALWQHYNHVSCVFRIIRRGRGLYLKSVLHVLTLEIGFIKITNHCDYYYCCYCQKTNIFF